MRGSEVRVQSGVSGDSYAGRGEGPERPRAPETPTSRPTKGRFARAKLQLRRILAYLGAFAVLALVLFTVTTGGALAASPSPGATPAPSARLYPPLPSGDARVIDPIFAFSPDGRANAESLIQATEDSTGATIYVFTQRKDVPSNDAAVTDAQRLFTEWQPGGPTGNGAVLLFDVGSSIQNSHAGLAIGRGFTQFLPEDERQAIVEDSMAEDLSRGNLDAALTEGLSRLLLDAQVMASGGCVGSACPTPGPTTPGASPAPSGAPTSQPFSTVNPNPTPGETAEVPAGPPYPSPVTGQRVYDYAGVFSPDTIDKVQATADGIEQRTGAQVVVYTQVKPDVDTAEAESDAQRLMDQWGVGRKGFDDGLVILFDLDESLQHGQVQLYAGPGFRSTFLSNDERQAIYQDDMLPYLKVGDLDDAILVAMSKVDAAATPAHAATLEQARQINAVLGLVVAPLTFFLVFGWAVFAWFRHGRDPHYIDDPSIYVAGPPAELTPASAAFLLDGGSSRRALTTALLDLASRGEISFREASDDETGLVGVDVAHGSADPTAAAVANARPLGAAEHVALADLRSLGRGEPGGYLDGSDLQRFSSSVDAFDDALEKQVIAGGWYKESPRVPRNRWLGRGALEVFLGIVLWFVATIIVASGAGLVAIALIAAGVCTFILAFSMPAKTAAGAMVQAMLAGYKRTLQATMSTARSLNQVVATAQLPWLKTPDQAMVWGTALGLQSELASVLQRSLNDVQQNQSLAATTYFPAWYASSAAAGGAAGFAGSSGGPVGGAFSPSMVPDFGSMLSALGTIGNPPPSTGSSGGGSSFSSGGDFGGGSSGGGGGGAGGGF
jgi:uncharacterized membrane protein YgcG